MLFYVLNKDFKPFMVIEDYESAIWTERYWECGDFSIEMYADDYVLLNIKTDMLIIRPDTDRVMVIEKIEIDTDVENGNKIKLSGRSLESILSRRIVWGKKNFMASNSTESDPKGIPVVTVLESLFNENIINPTNSNRRIENFVFEKPTDKTITNILVAAQYIGDSLYDIIVSLCKEIEMGFKITLSEDNKFVFSLFLGRDRSFGNTELNPYVIFSPNFENLVTSKYYESSKIYSNVAFISGASSNGNQVFAYSYIGANGQEPSGINRRELYVDESYTSNQKDDGTVMSHAEYSKILQEKGLSKLAENNIETAFDGTIDTSGSFQYGIDFFEGDIVQIESEYGHKTKVRITEVIIADDGSGNQRTCYPTFKQV